MRQCVSECNTDKRFCQMLVVYSLALRKSACEWIYIHLSIISLVTCTVIAMSVLVYSSEWSTGWLWDVLFSSQTHRR